ncbi:unnamed protein product [Calypogeia fissa]
MEEADRFGVCWGEEILGSNEKEEPNKKPNSIRQYASFYSRGRKYCLNDTVYLLSGDGVGPPYIGRIGKLYENGKDKNKQMHVRWFCRPCELPKGLPDVDYNDNCKEVFVMWGNGAKNINHPASTIRHCLVLCTSEEDWNTNVPSIEEIAAADHIFDRAYDLGTGTLRSLDSIVKHYGEHLVLGTGEQRQVSPCTKRAPKKSSKMTLGTMNPKVHQPLPLAVRASSDLPPLLDWQHPGSMEGFVQECNEGRFAQSKGAKDGRTPKAANPGSKVPPVKPMRNVGKQSSQKRSKVDTSDNSLLQQAQLRLADDDLPSPKVSHGRNTGEHSRGNAVLDRARQKGMLIVSSKQTASKEKKRPRANSQDLTTEKGKLKKPKLGIPSHPLDDAFSKSSKAEDNVTLSTAISQEQASEDVSPSQQKGEIHLKCILGLESQSHSSFIKGLNPMIRKSKKILTTSHVPAGGSSDDNVSPTKNIRQMEGNRNGNGESRVKPESFRSSKQVGSSSKDSRHAEVGSPHVASKKRPGSELEVGALKSKTMRHSDPQSINTEAQQACKVFQVNKISLGAKGVAKVSSNKPSSDSKSAETLKLPPQGLANKDAKTLVKNRRIFGSGLAPQKDDEVAALYHTIAPPNEYGRETFEPKKKIFNFPWEETLRMSLKQGTALLLQNLDPWFSSAEIEVSLHELLRVSCDVRMLTPKNFTCYSSGKALVLFRTQNAAEETLLKFTENLLIWSKDERPVLASLADANVAVSNGIHGFFNAELSRRGVLTSAEDKKNAVATSHCSQPNTIEYEMGVQWRVLQDRHAVALTIATEDQKVEIDHPRNKSKPKTY